MVSLLLLSMLILFFDTNEALAPSVTYRSFWHRMRHALPRLFKQRIKQARGSRLRAYQVGREIGLGAGGIFAVVGSVLQTVHRADSVNSITES